LIALTLADLIESITGIRPEKGERKISQAVVDSRQALPGSLFVAIPGENTDGHIYVEDAFQRGAWVALIQSEISQPHVCLDLRKPDQGSVIQHALGEIDQKTPVCLMVEDSVKALQTAARYWRRKFDGVRVIGITGSVGKSTTKEVMADVLAQRFSVLKNPGNLNNEIGLPLTMLQLTSQHQIAVLEMGFYVPGEIALLCDIALPQVGVITNIGTVHAERAGSQQAIARGKAELVQALPEDGVAILNYDDLLVREMAGKTKARVFYYGLTPQADLWADEVEGLGLEGIRFRLHYRAETLHIRAPLIGRHSVHTVLRTTAVALLEGLNWQEIVNGLHSRHTQLRLVAVNSSCGALLLDDTYNASPQSTLAALNLLEELDGHRIAVLGDMLELGPYERQGHEMVGVRVASVVDQLVTVGRLGELIAKAARKAGMTGDKVMVLEDSEQAIEYLAPRLCEGDVVLIKGSRGMNMDRIVTALEGPR